MGVDWMWEAQRVRFARERHATATTDGKLLQISAMTQEMQNRWYVATERAAAVEINGFRICV